MKVSKTLRTRLGLVARMTALAAVAVMGLARAPDAQADPLMLKAATTMVYGSAVDTYSFTAPSAGTVTAELTSVPWPVPLSALSFNVTDGTNLLNAQPSSLSPLANGPQLETYSVSAGTYFAHVLATAGGSLNLGLYSVMLTFTPSAVPLPAAAGMLLIGLLVFFGLRRTLHVGESIRTATFGVTA